MDQKLKTNLGNKDTWLRLVFMILLALAFNVTEAVVVAVVVFQFLAKLVTGKPNERLRGFGGSLGVYLRDIVAYLAFQSDDKPFPFASWPAGEAGEPAKAKTKPAPKPRRKIPPPEPTPGADDATEGTA